MNLEDHLGDIIRKARNTAGVSVSAAAQAAGLSAAELTALEQSGEAGAPVRFAALAELIGLSASKLQGIAQGWRPQPRELAHWREMRQIATEQGGNTVNCFLVWDAVAREAALFDTGWDAAPVIELVAANRLDLKHLFVTHSHEDHIAALEPLQRRFPALWLHTNARNAPPRQRNRPGDSISLGGLRISPRDVPGHADDGVIFLVSHWPASAPPAAIVGDTLFAGSLAHGFISTDLLKRKVREEILALPPETLLCPGHGPVTTVAEELAHNPFF